MKPLHVRRVLRLTLALYTVATSASADWVNFADETATRIRIRQYVDGSGAPQTDDGEKDIAAGDLDRDGWEDVVVVRKRAFSNPGPRQDLLLMNRSGVLTDRTAELAPEFLTHWTDARDVVLADFDVDGWLDVVIANTFGEQPVFYRNAGNDSEGRWLGLVEEPERLPEIRVPRDVNTLQICAVAAGDVTGDSVPDLYLSNYKEEGGTRDLLLINDGRGFFRNETLHRLGDHANVAFGTSVEIVDMDADGDQDIVKVSALYPQRPFGVGVFLLYNDGSGRFDTLPFQTLLQGFAYMLEVDDFNLDDQNDAYIVEDFKDRVVIAERLTPNGPSLYRTHRPDNDRTKAFGGNVKSADVDGDGDSDLGVSPIDVDIANCGFSSEFALYENTGRDFVDNWPSENLPIHTDPHDFAFLDLDRDGCLDLFMGLCQGWRVFIQTCEDG